MTQSQTAFLDPQLFAQALGVLERERPSRRAELLFNLLYGLVIGAFALTVLYVVQVWLLGVSMERARPTALAAASVYLLVLPVSVLNLGLLNQLRRAASLQRRLRPSWRKGLQARLRRRRGPLSYLAACFLVGMGSVVALFGVIGLVVESLAAPALLNREPDSGLFGLAIVMTIYGVSSIVLYYTSQGRQRLRVVSDLRASLISGQTEDRHAVVPARAYDRIARLDRERIAADRDRIIKAQAKADDERRYRYQESRAVREAKQALPSKVLMDVLNHVDRVIADPRVPATAGPGREIVCYEPVDGTDLELGYTVDPGARKITLFSLAQVGGRRPAPDEGEQASTPEYRIDLSESALASDDVLSPEHRKAVDETLSRLAENPEGYTHLATATGGGQLVRRLPSPSVEVTYSVDTAEKTVKVVHLSPSLPARRALFVSYSHEDRPAFTKVMKYVRQLERMGLVEIWSDERIESGEPWNEKIQEALNSAHAALLLISQDFIDSEFIRQVEVPCLLGRARQKLTTIFWIPVRRSTVFTTFQEITAFQSLLIPPSVSLQDLEDAGKARSDRALLDIFERLRQALID